MKKGSTEEKMRAFKELGMDWRYYRTTLIICSNFFPPKVRFQKFTKKILPAPNILAKLYKVSV